ncbi:MAG: pentapeptide repeat-containing protein [Clostridia bacterium]|nr:pentapeptide repeat-containing protein [Oscillospiraceae bacterium]MBQ3551663.1 pentapeptide repeat-containing protein [Clostridia bacterium]
MSKNGVKGFKVFNSDWKCRGFKYEVGGVYEDDSKPEICKRGFHFCEKAVDCFNYYSFDPNNKVAEVIALGEIDSDGTKSCTNKIEIIREIPWRELLEIVNVGKNCTGFRNSGDRNSGNWNSGDWNSGNRNSGNQNSGDWNSGNRNSGNRNSGNWNSGNWNKTNFSNGCFNTTAPKIHLFNRSSKWTYHDWLNCEARYLLDQLPGDVLEYIWLEDMTDEEKAAHPEAEITGGYLRKQGTSEAGAIWWRGLSKREKAVIKAIPNFDAVIFKDITGIDVEEE